MSNTYQLFTRQQVRNAGGIDELINSRNFPQDMQVWRSGSASYLFGDVDELLYSDDEADAELIWRSMGTVADYTQDDVRVEVENYRP